jgi:hypothetical protein
MESMVLPMPFSSFRVGSMMLIFRMYHSKKNVITATIYINFVKTKKRKVERRRISLLVSSAS